MAKNEPVGLVLSLWCGYRERDDEVKFDLVISVKFALSASEIPLRGVKCLRTRKHEMSLRDDEANFISRTSTARLFHDRNAVISRA